MKKYVLLLTFLVIQLMVIAQTEIPLYSGPIPGSIPTVNKEHTETEDNRLIVHNISKPTLTIFEPAKEKKNGAAVIICPGGAYIVEAIGHEGYDVARRLNQSGITCFVLKYRLPDDSTMTNKSIGPLQDAQRAIQFVRENSDQWGIDKKRIGIMGFSAGGHLASTAGTHFDKALIPNPKNTSLRPDFMILVYPVINLTDSLMHEGSRINLLGKNPSQEMIKLYSNDLQVNKNTPPAFLVHARDDDAVKVQNSIHFYNALQKHHIDAQLYFYERGGHGFGLHNPTSNVQWIDLAIEWLRKGRWLDNNGRK